MHRWAHRVSVDTDNVLLRLQYTVQISLSVLTCKSAVIGSRRCGAHQGYTRVSRLHVPRPWLLGVATPSAPSFYSSSRTSSSSSSPFTHWSYPIMKGEATPPSPPAHASPRLDQKLIYSRHMRHLDLSYSPGARCSARHPSHNHPSHNHPSHNHPPSTIVLIATTQGLRHCDHIGVNRYSGMK